MTGLLRKQHHLRFANDLCVHAQSALSKARPDEALMCAASQMLVSLDDSIAGILRKTEGNQ